jgi:hypothetical protein
VRIKSLEIGVESITRWRVDDEVHLPKEGPVAPAFLPLYRPLHEILHRPSLDERLPNLLQPATVDPELMEPAKLTEARIDARSLLHEHARHSSGHKRALLERAAGLLEEDVFLDDDVRAAIAMLLRG